MHWKIKLYNKLNGAIFAISRMSICKERVKIMDWKEAKGIIKKDPKVLKEIERLEPFYQIINQLLSLRKEKDLTQRELAELINTTQPCIDRLESGKYNPSLRFLQKIADACDKKIEIRFIPKLEESV